jgi:hypothetical protein
LAQVENAKFVHHEKEENHPKLHGYEDFVEFDERRTSFPATSNPA